MQSDEQAGADIRLIERIAARDAGAVGELYDRHNRLLYSLVLRILRDRSEAEEVLQEVFVTVWTRAETYDATLGAPAAWLVGIARNRAIDRLRANARRPQTVEMAPWQPDTGDDPETRTVFCERRDAIARALGTLPRDQRELIEQAYFLGLTQSELSERHRLPLGTVKTRIRSAMTLLRQQLVQTYVVQ
jgi:RNA polymerase sigma-70 factor, ECF subfamily